MCPSCVEVTPKLTTCAIQVDSAAGLKQPRERSIVTRCAQKSLRVVDYQDSALGAQPCSTYNITCDVLVLCTTFQLTYAIAARYLPLETLQPCCHMLCIVMHALLPSITYTGKVECSHVPYRVCQACSSLLLTCLSLQHSYTPCLHSYMPCLHSYMPCLRLTFKISYACGLDMVKLSLFENAASMRSICVHALIGQIMLCA